MICPPIEGARGFCNKEGDKGELIERERVQLVPLGPFGSVIIITAEPKRKSLQREGTRPGDGRDAWRPKE